MLRIALPMCRAMGKPRPWMCGRTPRASPRRPERAQGAAAAAASTSTSSSGHRCSASSATGRGPTTPPWTPTSGRRASTAATGDRAGPMVPPWTPSPDPAAHAWHRSDLACVLVHPVIPHNTGATARTCAAAGVPLIIVGPIGFSLADKGLRRAGLDYWPSVAVAYFENWAAFYASVRGQVSPPARLVAFSKLGTVHYAHEGLYAPPAGGRTYLLMGAETTGLPPEAHAAADAVARIPIVTREVRSLNLAVSAGIGIFEAVRQQDGAVFDADTR